DRGGLRANDAGMSEFFYYLRREVTHLVPRLGSRIFCDGLENVPREGPGLILSNHISHFDPSFITTNFPRVVHFMADKPLLDIPVYGWLLKKAHVFAIDRT